MAKKQSPPIHVFLLLVVFCLLLIFLNINIWQERAEKRRQILLTQEELNQTIEQKDAIQMYDMDDTFLIEKIAREQLLMAREGEEVVVILRREEETEESEEEKEPTFFEQLMEIIR